MPETYSVTIDTLSEIHALPDSWGPETLRIFLALADMDDVSQLPDGDLLDMAIMMLQDLGNQKGGELVLEAIFAESMRPGVRQNLIDDLEEQEPWSDIAEIAHQRGVFDAVILLQQAFPNRYGTPDAASLQLTVTAQRDSDAANMTDPKPDWLVRILAAGLSERETLIRLYGAELLSGNFDDAQHILWHQEQISSDGKTSTYHVILAKQWIGSMGRGDAFTVST